MVFVAGGVGVGASAATSRPFPESGVTSCMAAKKLMSSSPVSFPFFPEQGDCHFIDCFRGRYFFSFWEQLFGVMERLLAEYGIL